MTSEQKEIQVKTKMLAILRPLFEKNPSLQWALTDKEIESVMYNYVNKIYDDIKEDLK